MAGDQKQKSWFARILGRSLISVLFGNFFEKKNNSAGIVAIMLVGTNISKITKLGIRFGQVFRVYLLDKTRFLAFLQVTDACVLTN